MNAPSTSAMRQDSTSRPSPPHTSQDLVDHLVQACEEQDVLYVVFWLRKMKDKGLLWAVGGRDGVDAPHTWKGVSALQLVASSPYTSFLAFILELLLLNLEKPEASSVQFKHADSCASLQEWARDVARRVVDSRGRSAVDARELLSLKNDGSAALWIDANLPPCPTPQDQLTGWGDLPPPPSTVKSSNGIPACLEIEPRTPSPPQNVDLPVVKVVPPTPQANGRVALVLEDDGCPPRPDHDHSEKLATPSSSILEGPLRAAEPSDFEDSSSAKEGEFHSTFSSGANATGAEQTCKGEPDVDIFSPTPYHFSPTPGPEAFSLSPPLPPSRLSPLSDTPALSPPALPSRPLAGPVRLHLTNLPLEATGSKIRIFLSAKLGIHYVTQPRVLLEGSTARKQAWVTIADRTVAARAAQIAENEVVEWNGQRIAACVISINDGPSKKTGKGYAPMRLGSYPPASEKQLKKEPEDTDFASSHSAWHSATSETERSLGLPDRKILLNNDDEGLAKFKVKVEDEDVEMADAEETKPSPPQDLPFSLPFLASTSASFAVDIPSYVSPSPTPPPPLFAGSSVPANPYRSRLTVDRSRPYRPSPPPPQGLSPVLRSSKLSQGYLKGHATDAPRPSHTSPYPSPELSPPPTPRSLAKATPPRPVSWATSPVSPDVENDAEANPFAALFSASSASTPAPSAATSPAPPPPALRSTFKDSTSSTSSFGGSRDAKRRRTEKRVHWAKGIAIVVGEGAGHVAELEEPDRDALETLGGWSETQGRGLTLRW